MTSTNGRDPDPDGFRLAVDLADTVELAPNGHVELNLPPGWHTGRLLGVVDHCSVRPSMWFGVRIESEEAQSVTFTVNCPGVGIRVTTITTGLDRDPDGYRVRVDQLDQGPVPANGTVLARADLGTHMVSLTGVEPNCLLEDSTPRPVTVLDTEIGSIEFVVRCATANPVLAFDGSGDIYVVHADGSGLQQLTSSGTATSYNGEPAWSPDGTRIAYSQLDGGHGAAIYVMDADGANPRRLSPQGVYDASPSWSPDGSRIAFENRADSLASGGHIFVMSSDGTHRVQLTSNRQPNSAPAWSPDGQRIAYTTYEDLAGDGGTDIYVMDVDGHNRARLTTDDAFDTGAAWSPDGRRIAFSRDGDPYIMDADGGHQDVLNHPPLDSSGWYAPAWSPGGLMLAFTGYTDCHLDDYGDPTCDVNIWLLDLGTGSMHELRLGVPYPHDPDWRP